MKCTILFNGHDFKFLDPVISHYREKPGFEVLIDSHRAHVITDTDASRKMLEKADTVFCEWALGNAVWYSKNKRKDQKLIVRLHRQELTTSYLNDIEWENVDHLILICPRNLDIILERFPFLKGKTKIIYNPIDCDSFDLPKLYGSEFNLGMIGNAPKLKAPHLAFEILEKLKRIDSRYTLFIKGKQPWEYDWLWRRTEERAYYDAFYARIKNSPCANSVVFDPHGNDIGDWFSKIGFILSTSDLEGSHQAVAEGMASGAVPVIRNWAGSEQLYPDRFIFRNTDEAAALVRKWSSREHYDRECKSVKQFARELFHQDIINAQYDALIAEAAVSVHNRGDAVPGAPLRGSA